MSDADKAKALKRSQERQEQKLAGVSQEMYFLARLGYYYGWAAVQDFSADRLSIDDARGMVAAAEIIQSSHKIDDMNILLAIKSTKAETFKKLTKRYFDDVDSIV